ncbi:MAG: DUF5123 domain-containing protein [Prevotella sp.]|nr:DUF5123 domain-containing protein [Prevotella sp.]
MKKIFKSMLFLLAASTSVVLTSCSDDDLPTADALFRPVITESDNIEHGLDDNLSPYMIVTWDNYTDATEYVITAEANDGSDTKTITTEETTCTFTNLEYDKEYNVSLRCVNTNTGLQSKDYTLTTTTLDYPTKLLTPGATDIIDVAARISWSDIVYDNLEIYKDSNDSLVTSVVLTDADNAVKNVIVEGLAPKTTYQARVYVNDQYLGKKRFTTSAEESYDGVVVDLRKEDMSDDDLYKWFSAAHLEEIVSEYPDQDITIVLKGGLHYRLQSLNLPQTTGTIKFVTGLTLEGNAIFDCASEFGVPNGVTVGGITLEKINFLDYEGNKTSDNYGGHYLINASTSGHLENMTFKSCQIKYKRGIIRARSTFQLDNLVFDDCIIDSIGGYGIAMAEDQACVYNMTMNNTTCANVQRTFVNDQKSVAGNNTITNCTFVYCVGASRNFDDITDCKSFTIKNCLFGIPGETPQNTSTTFSGWNSKCNPVPTADDCYFTSDVEWKMGGDPPTPTAQFAGTTIGTDTKGTFKDPEHSDFTIINTKELQNVGDPRWY